MHVFIDATPLIGVEGRRGEGRFASGLLSGLAQIPDVTVTSLGPSDVPATDALRATRVAPGRLQYAEQRIRGRRELRRGSSCDVTHVLRIHPPGAVPSPYVQTLLDVIPMATDDPALATERRRWVRSAPRYRNAERVIAISNHAALEGQRHLGLDPDRVVTAPPGVGPEFSAQGPVHRAPEPYILLVAEHSRRKGFADAFEVIAALAERGHQHRLAVVGRIAPWVHQQVHAEVAASPRPDRIDLLGFAHDIASIYRGAAATIVPSRREGFGLPALESMACGTPVVAYDNTSLPEAVGDAGILVPDGKPGAMADACERLINDSALASGLVSSGLARAARFTWLRCAELHVDAYRAAMEMRPDVS